MAVSPTKLEEAHAHAPGYAAAPAPAEGAQDAIDLRAYWRTILRRRWIIIPFFVATVLVTTLVTLRQTKIYDATCTLIIDLSAPKVLDTDMKDVVESGTGGYWYSKEYYETQYKVITSRAVAQRVSDKLALATNLRFLRLDGIQDPAEREKKRLKKDSVEILLDNLKVQPVKDSRVVRLRYEDPDPALAALVANTWAESYIAENLSVKSVTTQNASDWLEQQLADLEKKLDASGKALFDFKKTHDIVATSWEDRQSMVSQRLTATNDALTKARVRKAELEARNSAIAALGAAVEEGGAEAEALDAVAASMVIQQLKMRYAEAQTECADLKVRYLDNHPRLEACAKKVGAAKKALQDEIHTTLEAARLEYRQVAQSERNLQALLNETKRDAFSLNQYERDYLELKRTHDNNQRLYELVLKRLKDTGVTGLLQVSNVRILDRARPAEKPVRPNVLQNLLLALLLGLVGGVGLAFGAEYLDTSITTQDQIEEKLGLTFLGLIPSIPKNADGSPQDLFVSRQPKSPVAECVRSVRTNLLFMSPEKPLKTILVTSSGPQEGKTTTAASLAATMATSGNRTLLVDADMRRPRVHRIFGASNARGLSSLIVGEGALDESVQSTEIPNLHVLACGPVPPNPAELLHTATFKSLLAEMGRKFGSEGSVIPIFQEQIASGGPVTVTHPEMQRYFMTIPEASQLVLQAGTMGEGGEIFVLDMGEPVRIADLARDLITLSGLKPDEDIEIRYTGIRPGEKLFEELSVDAENADKTRHPKIFVGRFRPHAWEKVQRQIAELVGLSHDRIEHIKAKFREIVPEYHPDPHAAPAAAAPAKVAALRAANE